MQDVRLYLDGELVDIDPSTSIVETKQVNSMFDLRDRQTSFTSSFTVLLNKASNNILDRIGDYYNTSNKPYQKIVADVYRNGVATTLNGTFIIKKIIGRGKLKGNVQDGVASFFQSMGNKSLSALDFNSLVHEFSTQNQTDSFNNVWQDGYVYALADYGVFQNPEYIVDYLMPSVYLKWLWEKLFEDNGFTYSYIGSNNIFESDEFKTKALTIDSGYLRDLNTGTPNVLKLQVTMNSFLLQGSNPTNKNYAEFFEAIDVNNLHNIVNNESVIKVDETGVYSINFNLQIFDIESVSIELNGNVIETYTQDVNTFLNLYLLPTDVLKVFYYTNDLSNNLQDLLINVSYTKLNDAPYIIFNSFFNTLKQKEFFKSILQMYGLVYSKINHSNHFEFISFQDLLEDRSNSQNLSGKFNSLIDRKYTYGNYGKENHFRYNYPNTEDEFADASFTLADETLPRSVDLFKLPYNALEYDEANDIYLAPLFTIDTKDDGTIKEVKSRKTKPYIINVSKENTTVSLKSGLGGGTGTPYTGVVAFADFQHLSMSDLMPKYYQNFIKTKTSGKLHTINLELTALDVANFDFLRLVYLSQFQKYFYCNKIISYRENRVTKVELIEV